MKQQPIFLLDDKIKWKTFKLLQEKLVKSDGGPTPIGGDKAIWGLLKKKMIHCWFDPKVQGDMKLGLKLPKNREVRVISSP